MFTPFVLGFSEYFSEIKLNLLVDISLRLIDEFDVLVSVQGSELTQGKIVAYRCLQTK
jgi:hypothetical protein